jgi:integrase
VALKNRHGVYLRSETYHMRKRVPLRFRSIDDRFVVHMSLHTSSEILAYQKAEAAWNDMLIGWEAQLAGLPEDAEARFEAAKDVAASRGLQYLPTARVARLPRDELLQRVEAIPVRREQPDMVVAAAVLGGVDDPGITVTRAMQFYWSFARDKTLVKSDEQVTKWKSPILKAVKNFVGVVGDKGMHAITADDMLKFRDWWLDRIEDEGLNPSTANKDFIHLGKVLKEVNLKKRLGLNLPLTGYRIQEGEKNTRPPFSDTWIKDRILADGALGGLPKEARCIVLGMVNTGYRPSEACGLLPEHIHLDATIPHIEFRAVGRQLKSQYAKRMIPLTGVSLEAFKECPKGFSVTANNVSKLVGDYFTERGLRETPDHTLYSLRHSFEDRMLAAGMDERIRRDLLGHRLDRERYGKGASLEAVAKLMSSVAL